MSVPVDVTQCLSCRRLKPGSHRAPNPTCDAFLAGIPTAIFENEIDHRQPYPGDRGMTWLAEPGAYHPLEVGAELED